ncbi:MAG: hypothetical protein Q8O41_02275 [Candidatus Methanoperedens sp.]|nr:hypothetical protein [Candidatus Methanoperedens sp.]
MNGVKNGAALVGRKLNNCADKAAATFYKGPDKTVIPICDAFGQYCLETFMSSPGIPAYRKEKVRRIIHDDSAVVKITYPTGDHSMEKADYRGVSVALGITITAVCNSPVHARES